MARIIQVNQNRRTGTKRASAVAVYHRNRTGVNVQVERGTDMSNVKHKPRTVVYVGIVEINRTTNECVS